MYFAFGWPKVLNAIGSGANQEDIIYVFLDQDYFVLVSTSSIQLWTGGQHRVKLGTFIRVEASIKSDGLNRRAFWCSSKRSLAVLTYNNVLQVYGMHSSKEAVLSTSSSLGGSTDAVELKRVDIYLQHSHLLVNDGATAGDLVGDSRSILLGFSDGSLQLYSWQTKLRGTVSPFGGKESGSLESQRSNLAGLPRRPAMFEAGRPIPERRTLHSVFSKSGLSGSAGAAVLGRTSSTLSRSSSTDRVGSLGRQGSGHAHEPQSAPGIECMDYSPGLHMIALVLTDGRCAILQTGPNNLAVAEHIELSHWLYTPGSGATCVRVSRAAQLVALGLASGEVALYGLWASQGAEPVRIISLGHWGYEPETTGSVADIQWSPDSRALAVGWRRSGVGLWSPSGCRLMCSLRQSARSSGQPPQGPGVLEGGVALMAWGLQGYRLVVAERSSTALVLEVTLAKSLPNSYRIVQPQDAPEDSLRSLPEIHFLQADDRLLQISDTAHAQVDPSQFDAGSLGDVPPSTDLVVHHLKPPHQYIAANWPLQHAALSSDGVDIAVAGRRGLALFSRRSARWRLFGDVSQEKGLAVHALLWLPRMVLVCATLEGSQSAASLLLFPRYHLDNASILANFPLDQVPLAVDVLGAWVVVASAPLDIRVLRVDLTGDLTPLGTPTATFTVICELSIMSVGQPLRDIALVEVPALESQNPGFTRTPFGGRRADSGPQHCVLLRAGGLMSILDMEQGSEVTLAEDIECFWLSGQADSQYSGQTARDVQTLTSAMEAKTSFSNAPSKAELTLLGAYDSESNLSTPKAGVSGNSIGPFSAMPATNGRASTQSRHHRLMSDASEVDLDGIPRFESEKSASTSGRGKVEIPWWTYGARGMQLWFPSALAEPLSPSVAQLARPNDPELEFDREVYPIGISLAEVSIIGVTQRVARSLARARGIASNCAHSRLPSFQVVPESQPVLPCLLRRLLQQGKAEDARTLALRHASAPHFSRSLEWLLFTSLEINADLTPSPSKQPFRQFMDDIPEKQLAAPATAGALLTAAANLIRQFPQFAEIVVSVARKTDAAMWAALFAAVGKPSLLLEGLLEVGALQSAACFLLIVDRLEGAPSAHALALRLIRVTVAEGQYELAAELLRFIVPPGDDNLLVGLPRPPVANGQILSAPKTAQQPKASWLGSWLSRKEPQAAALVTNGPGRAVLKRHDSLYPPGMSEDTSAWQAAWRLVGHHAWRLFDQGRLRAAAHLALALMAVGASLPALLLGCPEGAREGVPSAHAILAALAVAERELPVLTDRDAANNALILLEACQATATYDWLIALALLVDNTLILAEVRQQQPDLWYRFAQLARGDPRAQPYQDMITAVEALPGLRPSSAQAAHA